MRPPSIVVIGGGVSGLVSALHLSSRGAQVAVLERAEQLGGRLRSTLEGEWKKDPGLHLIHGDGPWSRTIRKSSNSRLSVVSAPDLNVLKNNHWSQPPFTISRKRHGEVSRFAAYKWIKKIASKPEPGRKWSETVSSLDGDEKAWTSVLGTLTTMEWNTSCLHHTVRRAIKNGILRQRLTIPVHGWSEYIGRLIHACEELGTIFSTDCHVTAIEIHSNGVTIDVSNQDQITADAVVFACPPAQTHRLISPLKPPVSPPPICRIRVAHGGLLLDSESMLRPFIADMDKRVITLNLADVSQERLPENLRGRGSSLESLVFEIEDESDEEIEKRWHTHLESCAPGLQRHIIDTRPLRRRTVDYHWKPGSDTNRDTLVEWMSQNRMVSVAHESSDYYVLLDGIVVRARNAADRLFKGRQGRRGRRRRAP